MNNLDIPAANALTNWRYIPCIRENQDWTSCCSQPRERLVFTPVFVRRDRRILRKILYYWILGQIFQLDLMFVS